MSGDHGALPTATGPSQAEPIILISKDDSEQKPLLYACGKCGAVHSPSIYLAKPEVQHATAMEAARDCYNCRTHNHCKYCGEECHKGTLACHDCFINARIEQAVEVADDGGPYFGFGDDQIYHDMDEARDAGHEWVRPCTVTYPRIDPDTIFENLTEEMFEDAGEDDLVGTVELAAAIKRFNEAQTTPTYWADEKRKIRVPRERIEAFGGDALAAPSRSDESRAEGLAQPSPSQSESSHDSI